MHRLIVSSWKWVKRRWYWCLLAVLLTVGLFAYLRLIYTTAGFLQWSGFKDKTLWDVIELAIIPSALAIIGYLFNKAERKSERELSDKRAESDRKIASDQFREAALQAYFDRMTELIIDSGLRQSDPHSEARVIGRARTLTVLDQLDGTQRAVVLRFLYEADLITKGRPVVNIGRANLCEAIVDNVLLLHIDLTEVNLRKAVLAFVGLPEAELAGADLTEAVLTFVDMRGANLRAAKFVGTTLLKVDLTGADLRGTKFVGISPRATSFELAEKLGPVTAKFDLVNVRGSRYNSQTRWPKEFDPVAAGAILDENG